MSDIRKLLDIINETTVAGSVATVAAPMGEMQKRVEETATEETKKPEVIEYGMWENSALATTSKLKKNRGKSAKVVKSIYGEDVQSETANPKQQAAIAIAKKKEVAEGKFTVNRKTGAKLDPRTGAELPPKEKPLTMKDMFRQPKSTAPKLTLDDVWMKIQSVVSNIYPDGDPIDHLAPWLEKHGIRDFKIGEILDRAAKKNGYKDLYDYWDSMGDLPLSEQGVAEDQLNELSPELLARYRKAKGDEYDHGWKWDPEKEAQRQAHNEPIAKKVSHALYKELEARRKQSGVGPDYRPLKKDEQGVAETTGDKTFDNMISNIINSAGINRIPDHLWKKIGPINYKGMRLSAEVYGNDDPYTDNAYYIVNVGDKEYRIHDKPDYAFISPKDITDQELEAILYLFNKNNYGSLGEKDHYRKVTGPAHHYGGNAPDKMYEQDVAEGSKIPMVKDPETGRKHPDYGNTGMMRDLAAAAQKRKSQTRSEPTKSNPNNLSKYNDFPDTNKHPWMPVMIGEPSWANIPKSLEVWARRKGIHRDIDISHDPEGKIWTIKGKSGYPHDTEYTYRWKYDYDGNQFEPVEQGVAEETEQIDEVSMEELLKYVPNAVADLSNRQIRINTGKGTEKDAKKVQDRKKGLSRAAEKIGYMMAPESVAEGSLNEGQYEMMMRNGQVKRFVAKDDADAKRIAKGHGAKSVIRLKGGVPAGKVSEQSMAEGTLEESDLILNPASLSKLSRDLVSHEQDRTDHEVEMAKSDLYQAGKNAVKVFELIRDISEEEGLEGWVQEKIIKANDYLNTVREYLEGKQMESMDGVAPGTKMFTSEEKPGLWANIHAKRKRIKAGSGEHMRKPGSKGAPSAQDFKNAAK